ncbi:MAG: hypothetical protein OSB21_06775 [Myxococcota bacterium]|nr:hypothetical protein [Myxococcota bacterium]
MPVYGFLLMAATASTFGGGGSLFGARFPGPESHPGAVIWQAQYLAVSSISRDLPHPDVDLEFSALDPGRGFLGAATGMRYRYHGAERHLVGGSASLGLRLGGGFGLGFAGAYEADQSMLDSLRWGVSYAAWRAPGGAGLILGLDRDSAKTGDQSWRMSTAFRPVDGLQLGWDHRFDGSNYGAIKWRFGPAEWVGGFELDGDYQLGRYGSGLRWHDKGGWLGLTWGREKEVNRLSFELVVPVGQAARTAR